MCWKKDFKATEETTITLVLINENTNQVSQPPLTKPCLSKYENGTGKFVYFFPEVSLGVLS